MMNYHTARCGAAAMAWLRLRIHNWVEENNVAAASVQPKAACAENDEEGRLRLMRLEITHEVARLRSGG